MANCPTCDFPDVYNSGWSVQCVNEDCHHYSKKHAISMGYNPYIEAEDTEPIIRRDAFGGWYDPDSDD